MSSPPEPADNLSHDAERLAQLARSELGTLSPAARSDGLRRLHARLDGRGEARWRKQSVMAALALVAILGIGVGRFWPSTKPSVLEYQVDGKAAPASGVLLADAKTRVLRFSEGTEVALEPGSKAHVRSVAEHGAALALDSGSLLMTVTPKASAEWSVSAGPFLIRVTGTRFTTAWQPDVAELQVRLDHGSVSVTGPLSDEPIRLRAGQELSIRLHQREVTIRELASSVREEAAASPATPQLVPASSAVPKASPAASAPPLTPSPSWSARLAAGQFDDILRDARARGVDQVLQSASLDDLVAVADAARFKRDGELARRALMAQRLRFSSSARARDAAFLLGRLEEAASSQAKATEWYDRYLAEAPRGTYASEALGRKMLVVQATQGKTAAEPMARQYLEQFPQGAYAQAARGLVESH
jgi:hypothetical protein